jgi:hypothetical protein
MPCGLLFKTNPANPKSVRKKRIKKRITLGSAIEENAKKYEGGNV